MVRCWILIAALALALLGLPAPAHAYIDPSAGSTVLQLILAGTAGILVLLKAVYRRIRAALGLGAPAAEGEPRPPAAPP